MCISKIGLYALEAAIRLVRSWPDQPTKIHEIAASVGLSGKFLELILLDLKNARLVEGVRGVKGGYRLRRAPSKILLGEIIRTVDGPLAHLGNAEALQALVKRDKQPSALHQDLLDVRNATAGALDHTPLADLCGSSGATAQAGESLSHQLDIVDEVGCRPVTGVTEGRGARARQRWRLVQ